MPTTHKLFQNLNEAQIEAVEHKDGPALVVAGPGSGKTRVLTHRVGYLISEHKTHESQILCVTFTNKAAEEIKSRVSSLLSEGGGTKLPWGGTFHSICARILRKDGYFTGIPISFVIYDKDDRISIVRGIMKDFGMDPKKINPHAVLATISSSKLELIIPEE